MSFGLDALLDERLKVFPADASSITHSPSSISTVIHTLIKKREDALTQAKEHAATIDKLSRRIYSEAAPDATLSAEVVQRIQRLENECQNLRKEKVRLRENLNAAEKEAVTLQESVSAKAQKVKGALKTSKAKNAASDKKRHLDAERRQRKECSNALKELARQAKITEDLRAEVEMERSDYPHLRDTEGRRSNFTVLVVPEEMRIKRAEHMKTLSKLRFRHKSFLHEAHKWHQAWMTRLAEEDADEGEEEMYASESDEDGNGDGDEVDDDGGDKLYGGMVEGGDMMTGAEYDGWRSMKGIQAVCRTAEARYGQIWCMYGVACSTTPSGLPRSSYEGIGTECRS